MFRLVDRFANDAAMIFRKNLRRYIARTWLQEPFRLLYRFALAGMNYGGAGSARSAGDELGLKWLGRMNRDCSKPLVIFDVGANVGGYVGQVLRILAEDTIVYAFEPSVVAFERLRLAAGERSNVHLVAAGVGAAEGSATLWSAAPGSVLASTYVHLAADTLPGEPIRILTLDEFCEQHRIARLDLLKLDLEGGELDALRGATRLLNAGAIDIIQFEFGQPSLGARTYFVDLFRLLRDRYEIYRVLPDGLARIADYHESLEVFMSTNYLAVSRARLADFAAAARG